MHLVSSPSAFLAMICGFKVRAWLSGAAEEVCAYHTEGMLRARGEWLRDPDSRGTAMLSCNGAGAHTCFFSLFLAGLASIWGPFQGLVPAQRERVMGWLPPIPCFFPPQENLADKLEPCYETWSSQY